METSRNVSTSTYVLLLLASFIASAVPAAETIDFNRDVRRILSDKCFHCHGPDASNQDSDFRLDSFASATDDLGGYAGVVPGDLAASELHRRIHEADDLSMRMPPDYAKLKLSEEEKAVLDRWIVQGAGYDQHWSFAPRRRPELPTVRDPTWTRNGLDYFVLKRLEDAGLKPSPPAERERLIRRVTLDLTGLPPTPDEVTSFFNDRDENAYGKVVERLLGSTAYGEHFALAWLEAARYADSGGYQNDIHRTQWPWRDWVIEAFNQNKPFDEFTVEQIAGDLLDDPTANQRLATAFNRNHRINNEGGIIPEEFRIEYVADRVETMATIWLGLTVGCARCHDHKYDPIPTRDFYSLFAFFNQVPENGRDGAKAPRPNMRILTAGSQTQLDSLTNDLRRAREAFEQFVEDHQEDFETWLKRETKSASQLPISRLPVATSHVLLNAHDHELRDSRRGSKRPEFIGDRDQWPVPVVKSVADGIGAGFRFGERGFIRLKQPHGPSFDANQPHSWVVRFQTPEKLIGFENALLAVWDDKANRGYRIILSESGDSRRRSYASFQIVSQGTSLDVQMLDPLVEHAEPTSLVVTFDGTDASGVRMFIHGQPAETKIVANDLQWIDDPLGRPLLLGTRSEQDAKNGQRGATFRGGVLSDVEIYDEALQPSQALAIANASPHELLLANHRDSATDALRDHYFVDSGPEYARLSQRVIKSQQTLRDFESEAFTLVSVMQDGPTQRKTYVLDRGAYDNPRLDDPVSPATLEALPPMAADLPRNRLGLARWLVDPDHPLTARVAVNRFWQNYFGRGIVATQEDFGTQGASPTHPDLLDWLASEFVDSGWNIKRLQKIIVTSATYRQSSRVDEELLRIDPKNELLSRGARFRLSGQAIRDQALAAAGLLCRTIGGPPVMPYQPEGLWDEVSAKGYKYILGSGDDLYRRSLYTFWRRTVPPPSMMNFDNPTREMCSVNANRTNTPLQALNLMNDPQFLEAARCLAEQMLRNVRMTSLENKDIDERDLLRQRLSLGHRRVLAREIDAPTLDVLVDAYQRYLRRFQTSPSDGKALVSIGESSLQPGVDIPQLAAMTMVASVLLNLDETVTRE
ncbi:MAG: PSD1 and planctomycete cytochrome C domain-containing protein [Planctomycetota bacterium]